MRHSPLHYLYTNSIILNIWSSCWQVKLTIWCNVCWKKCWTAFSSWPPCENSWLRILVANCEEQLRDHTLHKLTASQISKQKSQWYMVWNGWLSDVWVGFEDRRAVWMIHWRIGDEGGAGCSLVLLYRFYES